MMMSGVKRQPRICFVMHFHPDDKMGGAETQAWLIAQALAERQWQVHYVARRSSRWPLATEQAGVMCHGVPMRRRELAYFDYPTLKRTLDGIDADIYYQRVALPYTGMVAWYAQQRRKGFVWATAHIEDCRPAKFRGRVAQYQQPHKRALAWLSGRLQDVGYVWGARQADLIITQTAEHQTLLRHSFGLTSQVIPNAHPRVTAVVPRVRPPMVLWIGNLTRRKKAERFIALAQACQTVSAQFVMAGHPIDTAYYDELKPQIEAAANLTYLGGIPSSDAERLMGQATLFINTSDEEGFPNTFIQSWLQGTPVISQHVMPDKMMVDKQFALVSGSGEQLVQDTRRLLQDEGLWQQYSDNAVRYAQRYYTIEKVVDRYQQLFETVITLRMNHANYLDQEKAI